MVRQRTRLSTLRSPAWTTAHGGPATGKGAGWSSTPPETPANGRERDGPRRRWRRRALGRNGPAVAETRAPSTASWERIKSHRPPGLGLPRRNWGIAAPPENRAATIVDSGHRSARRVPPRSGRRRGSPIGRGRESLARAGPKLRDPAPPLRSRLHRQPPLAAATSDRGHRLRCHPAVTLQGLVAGDMRELSGLAGRDPSGAPHALSEVNVTRFPPSLV